MENITELCKIAYKYRTDKCPQINHAYTPFYYKMFKDKRMTIKKVFEMGIGIQKTMKYTPGYTPGASLLMWRDFFPNAHIYGADIVLESIFQTDRITTFLCDETKKEEVEKVIKEVGEDIDIFIDDGWHKSSVQANLCKAVMPLVKKDIFYAIEDVGYSIKLAEMLKPYETEVPYLEGRNLKYGNANKIVLVKNI